MYCTLRAISKDPWTKSSDWNIRTLSIVPHALHKGLDPQLLRGTLKVYLDWLPPAATYLEIKV